MLVDILQFLAQFVFVYLFQSSLYLFGICLLSHTPLRKNPFIICAFLSTIATYIVRLLPINFGIHTLLSLMILILLVMMVMKLPAQPVVKNALIITICILIFEGIVVLIPSAIMGKEKFDLAMNNPLVESLAGLIVNILLTISLLIYRAITKKRTRGLSHGKTGETINQENDNPFAF